MAPVTSAPASAPAPVQCSLPAGILLGMGNPLLDIQTPVTKEFLAKRGLSDNGAILADEKHIPLFKEITAFPQVEYIPGGATQNALRTFQWIVKEPKRAVFFGAVGSDVYSAQLQESATKAGVDVHYQINPNVKTGTCAVLIYEHHRSLCADLAAANTFTVDHIQKEDNKKLIDQAKFFYVSGFFLTVCPPAILEVAKHAAAQDKHFMLNFAAPFIPQHFLDPLRQALPYVDILFANEQEADAYARSIGLNTKDIALIAQEIANTEKVNKARPRVVIVTQGPEEIVVATSGVKEAQRFPVPTIATIVDTNGAGDAFVGGFLAELVRGAPLEVCIKCGVYAAGVVVQSQGCTFPGESTYHY